MINFSVSPVQFWFFVFSIILACIAVFCFGYVKGEFDCYKRDAKERQAFSDKYKI